MTNCAIPFVTNFDILQIHQKFVSDSFLSFITDYGTRTHGFRIIIPNAPAIPTAQHPAMVLNWCRAVKSTAFWLNVMFSHPPVSERRW
jgi:hypothetical protein